MKQATIEEHAIRFQEKFFNNGGELGKTTHFDASIKDKIIETPSLEEQYENDCALIDEPWKVWQYQKVIPGDWFNCTHSPLSEISDIGCRRHPHADIMIEYELADDGKKKSIQSKIKCHDSWYDLQVNPIFDVEFEYRFDPEYKKLSAQAAQESLKEVREIFKETDYDVFSEHAILSQELRRVIDEHVLQDDFVEKEAIEVIIGCIVRILQSDDCTADWLDIAKIAKLMAKS